KSYEVLLGTYLVWIVLLLAFPVGWLVNKTLKLALGSPDWLLEVNAYWLAFGPYARPGSVTPVDFLTFFGVCLGLSALLIALAIAGVRAVTVRQSARPVKAPRAGFIHAMWRGIRRRFGPSLNRQPILWREWHRRQPSRWAQWIWAVYALLAVAASVL